VSADDVGGGLRNETTSGEGEGHEEEWEALHIYVSIFNSRLRGATQRATRQSFDSPTGHSVALSDPILKNEWTSLAAHLDGAVPANAGVPGNGLPDQYNASKNDECHELDKLGSTQVSLYSQTSNNQLQVLRLGPSASTAPFVSLVAFVHSRHGAKRRVGRVHARVTVAVSPTTAYRPRMPGGCTRARLGSSTLFTSDGGSATRASRRHERSAFGS
jgi:hypothetical protein